MTTHALLTESHWLPDERAPLVEITIGDLLRDVAAQHPERVALIWGDPDPALRRSWTHREVLTEAERLAHALLERFAPGERVGVWSANSPGYVLLQRGLALAGLVLVPIDPAYRAAELAYVLAQSGAAGLFHAAAYRGSDLPGMSAAALADVPTLRMATELEEWVRTARASSPGPLPLVAPRDPFQIQYTSGTTGFPKGALLHHMGVLNMVRFVAERSDVRDGDVWVNAMPLFHIAGGVTTELVMLARAGTYVLLPRFDAGLLLELIETCGGTITLAVPTMLIAMLEHPDFDRRDRTTLRTVMSGAATVNGDLVARTKERFGCAFTNVYGQTEMHGIVTQTLLDDDEADQVGTIGPPMPQIEMKIMDPASGAVSPLGVPGEICTRGYSTMLGYFNMPEATAAAIDDEAWLHSGDLGSMDSRGYVTITGKLKDLIIRGGEKIYPREIEEVLFTHPGVSNVAVVGVPDERWGEQVAAVVRATDPTVTLDPGELSAFCQERLARYKTPRYWFVVDSYPMTPSGKIRKLDLVQQIADGTLAPVGD